jgi:hypothetical protein
MKITQKIIRGEALLSFEINSGINFLDPVFENI